MPPGRSIVHIGKIIFDKGFDPLLSAEEPHPSHSQPTAANADDLMMSEEAGKVKSLHE
jgi:hypothetical protein